MKWVVCKRKPPKKNVERKDPKQRTFSPGDPNTIYRIRKRNKAKTYSQRRKSYCVENYSVK